MNLAEPIPPHPTFADHAKRAIDDFSPAREVLLNPYASDTMVAFACDVLAQSPHWQDIRAVADQRNLLWSVPGSEVPVLDFAEDYGAAPKLVMWACFAALATVILAALVLL